MREHPASAAAATRQHVVANEQGIMVKADPRVDPTDPMGYKAAAVAIRTKRP